MHSDRLKVALLAGEYTRISANRVVMTDALPSLLPGRIHGDGSFLPRGYICELHCLMCVELSYLHLSCDLNPRRLADPTDPGFLAVVPLSGWVDFFDSAPNVVDLGYIKYKGNFSYDDTVAYLGVPYAEPPLGELRWRKPVSLNTTRVAQEAKNEVVDLTEYPDFCIQGSTGGESYVLGQRTRHCRGCS